MFEILVYVFENYLPEACPEPSTLARKLSAIGFEADAISDALHWLAGLELAHDTHSLLCQPSEKSIRCYDGMEILHLSAECRGFLSFLEQANAIDTQTREMIIERALAVVGDESLVMSLEKFKVIVLMVMWHRQLSLDNLVFEDLLLEEDDREPPLMH